MGHNITIHPTSGVGVTEVSEETAAEFREVFERLAGMPSGNAASVDFDTRAEANIYVREGKKWAEDNGLVYVRKPLNGNPLRVTYRLYVPTPEGGKKRGRKPKNG